LHSDYANSNIECQIRFTRGTPLRAISIFDSIRMNRKHSKTLRAIFVRPTSSATVFQDIEALVVALGGHVTEREGSRVKIEIAGELWRCHRPHPGKEAKRYQVEELRELLERVGVTP
jgi:hypothetical protein